MHQQKLLRLKDVVTKVGLSRSQVYKLIAKGLFPEQIKIGPKISAWPEHTIDKWISRQIEGGVQ
ncbi:AlpA family transcriptional regulator [Litorivicinus sp.]|nr:AlpA family transcriptional regulator [Litorivicinus sp.]